MRKDFGLHDRHSPFRLNPATFFAGGVPGLVYDLSDISTLFQDAAGTTPVTSVGDPVGRILDKSGNGNHATQSNASARPTFQQSGGLSFLSFDGSSDNLVTASINFTSTDKMTVCAGVKKQSDVARGVVAEFGDLGSPAQGMFSLNAPRLNAAPGFGYIVTGSGSALNVTVSGYPAPTANVLTGISSISDDVQTLRVDGVVAGTSSADQGTGNYGNYALCIGSRSGSSLFFNGHLHGLIVLGAQATDWQIWAAEQWMAQRTGISF